MLGIQVLIGGHEVTGRYDGTAVKAVRSVKFDWGRQRPYDRADPATLSMSVIDRAGDWATRTDLAGQSIIVSRTGPDRVMFRGSIASARARRTVLQNPVTGSREPVWIADLTASSTTADLAASVFTGPAGVTTREGLGGWSEQAGGGRRQDILNAGASALISEIQPLNQSDPGRPDTGTVVFRLASVAAARAVNTLELIETLYSHSPLAAVDIDPATLSVRPARFTTASAVRLQLVAGIVRLVLASARIIPAKSVLTPQGREIESTVSESIDLVQVNYEWYGKDPDLSAGSQKRTTYLSQAIQRATSRPKGGARRVLKIDPGLIVLDPSEFGYDVSPTNRAPGWVLDNAVALVNDLNDQNRIKGLRFDDRRAPLDAATTEAIYTPLVSATPVYFAGSVFNGIPNAGPQFQIIGGTFTYDKGWTHDVHLAPVRRYAAPSNLTLAQLFGSSSARLNQFEPNLTLDDLATANQGL